jgi:hypothetical protein
MGPCEPWAGLEVFILGSVFVPLPRNRAAYRRRTFSINFVTFSGPLHTFDVPLSVPTTTAVPFPGRGLFYASHSGSKRRCSAAPQPYVYLQMATGGFTVSRPCRCHATTVGAEMKDYTRPLDAAVYLHRSRLASP